MINLSGRNLLTWLDYDACEIEYLLKLSLEIKTEPRNTSALSGKNIVLLFEKASTRTRCAFELASLREGATATVLTNSHIGKKESIEDTANILGQYYDGILFRGFEQSSVKCLAESSGVPVWNGLTDEYHPTQALADVMTISESVNKELSRVKLVYVGDNRNNVAISLMIVSAKLGLSYVGLGPRQLFPNERFIKQLQVTAEEKGGSVTFSDDIDAGVKGADVIYTDVWVSMGEEEKLAKRIDLLKPYQVTMNMLEKTGNRNIKFMHCLPACHDTRTEFGKYVYQNFGLSAMEVTDEVFRCAHSVVYPQALNRIFSARAIIRATLSGE